jgi:hypothetical protein
MKLRRFVIPLVVVVMLLADTIGARQSGRSWMNGFIFDESATKGLKDAKVELIGDPNSPRLQSVRLTTQADESGKYSLKEIPYGDYVFQVSAPGYSSYEIKIYIAPDMLTAVHVMLRKNK